MHNSEAEPRQPNGHRGTLRHLTTRWLCWFVYPTLALTTLVVGTGIYLFRGLQTHRYYDWTILPVSDNRLEAVCGELTLYYLGWQDPRSEKPIGHVADTVDPEQCAKDKLTPQPTARFPGLKDKAVLAQLGCKPEGRSLEQARAWTCTQPVGAKLRSEIEAASTRP